MGLRALKPGKTTWYIFFSPSKIARNQICQTTSEIEEKVSFHAAEEVTVTFGLGFEWTGAKLQHHCLKWCFFSEKAWELMG